MSAALPTLVVLAGLPGAGKSMLAASLAAQLSWQVVDRDRIRAAMFPGCQFSEEEKDAASAAAWLAVEAHLAARRSCIVDGMTFAAERARLQARELADLFGARFVGIHLDCPAAVAARRLQGQGPHPAGDRDAALVARVAERFAPLPADYVRIDALLAPERVASAALAALA